MILWAATTGAAYFSQFFSLGRRILEGLQGYDYIVGHNTKSAELLFWLVSPRGAALLTGIFLVAFLVTTIRTFIAFERSIHGALLAAPPIAETQAEAKQIAEAGSKPPQPEPNFVCMGTAVVSTHEEHGIYVKGRHEFSRRPSSNAFAAIAMIRNKFDPSRKVGATGEISAEIIYRRQDGHTVEVNRGAWLGVGNWVNFGVNDTKDLIIAFADTHHKFVFCLVKDYTNSPLDIPNLMAELQHDFYNVEVRLISEEKGILYEKFDFSLEITREPEFNIELEQIKELTPKEIRQQLEDFLGEGSEYLREFPRDKQATREEIAIVDEWEQKVVKFISRYPDSFSTTLFLADYPEVRVAGGAQGGNWPSLKKLSRRIATLREFIDEQRKR